MHNVGTLIHLWEGFLPPHAVLMGRRAQNESTTTTAKTSAIADTSLEVIPSKILFLVSDAYFSRKDLQDLLHRMIAAMGLTNDEYLVSSSDVPAIVKISLNQKQVNVAASDLKMGALKITEIKTHSLEAVIQNASLKRETWEHLKQALLVYKQNKNV